jgi:hypothetical protein
MGGGVQTFHIPRKLLSFSKKMKNFLEVSHLAYWQVDWWVDGRVQRLMLFQTDRLMID